MASVEKSTEVIFVILWGETLTAKWGHLCLLQSKHKISKVFSNDNI